MLVIESGAALARALDSPLHPQLKAVLALRRDQLAEDGIDDLAEIGRFLCVLPGDTLADVEAAARTPLIADGRPAFEWCVVHGDVLEAPVVTEDSGYGFVLFVLDDDGADPALIDLLRHHAVAATLP